MKTFEDLQKANEMISTMGIEHKTKNGGTVTKDYAMVTERIKAFRFLYPEGSIETVLLSDDGEKCIFRAVVSNDGCILGTGTAYEMKNSSFINKTSYIENCETSAVGRALAMCGIGIDTSIASYEEVKNAITNQEENETEKVKKQKIDSTKIAALSSAAINNGVEIDKILRLYNVKTLADLTENQFSDINLHWKELKEAK